MASVSTLRAAEHKALLGIKLSGDVIDLGGDKNSEYQKLFAGDFHLTVLNYAPAAKPDIVHDLEKPLPMADASYDGALLVNVLEHIYHSRELVSETHRILKPGGKAVIVVPFLFPVHPSPHDYWRYTDETLDRMLTEAGFVDIEVKPLGSGVFAARMLMIERLLPAPLRFLCMVLSRTVVRALDAIWSGLARATGRKYRPSDYAVGYAVTAKRG